MIASNTITLNTKLPLKMNPVDGHAELSGLFTAAVVSQRFREMLLSNPEQALKQGYAGKSFALSAEAASLIVSLNAKTLPDLAKHVIQTLG
jgi:hypothetical protein